VLIFENLKRPTITVIAPRQAGSATVLPSSALSPELYHLSTRQSSKSSGVGRWVYIGEKRGKGGGMH